MNQKIIAFVLVSSFSAFAAGSFRKEGPSLNRRVRNLGMGNVGVALKGSHDSSPFYNPAGLNDLEKGQMEFLSPTVDVSKSAIQLIPDVIDFAKDVNDAATDADKVRVFNDFVKDQTGDFQHARLSLDIFNYARKNFAAGLFIDEKMDLVVRDQSLQQFNLRNLGDAAAFVSGAYGFWEGLLQMGVTFKPTVRFAMDETDQVVDYSDVVSKNASGDSVLKDQVKKIKNRRFGLGVDVGAKSNLGFGEIKNNKVYKMLQPQIGVAWQDIGNPAFDSAEDNEQSLSAGIAFHPEIWKLKTAVAFDMREINQETSTLSKMHAGVEVKLPWVLSVRGGLSQGYLTGGLTADLWVVKLDAAIYSEEVGVTTKQEGNLRYAARISFNI